MRRILIETRVIYDCINLCAFAGFFKGFALFLVYLKAVQPPKFWLCDWQPEERKLFETAELWLLKMKHSLGFSWFSYKSRINSRVTLSGWNILQPAEHEIVSSTDDLPDKKAGGDAFAVLSSQKKKFLSFKLNPSFLLNSWGEEKNFFIWRECVANVSRQGEVVSEGGGGEVMERVTCFGFLFCCCRMKKTISWWFLWLFFLFKRKIFYFSFGLRFLRSFVGFFWGG